MASDSLPPPENRIVVGCGIVVVDYLAAVAAYPKPDEKIRTTSLKVQGGGNAGNALTCVARLGLTSRLISKFQITRLQMTLKVGIFCTSSKLMVWILPFWWFLRRVRHHLAISLLTTKYRFKHFQFGKINLPVTKKTRTCIHTPGYPPMKPDDLSRASLFSALDGARIFYSDGRMHETALVLAQEAVRKKIPIVIDAERLREGLDDLLKLADYAICSAKFPQAWTEAPSVPSALVSILLRFPNIKFVIVTLGEEGCIMLERSVDVFPAEGLQTEEIDVEILLESLKQQKDESLAIPTCISSPVTRLRANGIGTVCGRLFLGTAEKIPPSELIDTTGAGDAFIGAVVYALCTDMQPETMLAFAAQVAAAKCRALGARTGLPLCSDPCLASFLHQSSKLNM